MSEIGDAKNNIAIDVLCKDLQNAERGVRQKALKELLLMVESKTEPVAAKQLFDVTYLHIIKCYTDRFEAIRSLAASVFSSFIECLSATNNHYLDYLVPVLKRRIGMQEIIEESEELRLQLLEQVYLIVNKFKYKNPGEDFLLSSYKDILDILLKTLSDPYAAVQRQACEIIKIMPKATPFQGEKVPLLVKPLISLLKHRHSATRIIGVETLGIVALHITNKDDNINKIIAAINVQAQDSIPQVRLACSEVGCMWMLNMRDRYSFFGHMLPMVLLGLIDENDHNREVVTAKFFEVGQQYYEENESNLKDIALRDDPVPNCEWISKPRPSLACRELVIRRFQQIHVIASEMLHWKEEVRLHSLKLLTLIIFYSEQQFCKHFETIYPSLTKCCQDTDTKVVQQAKYTSKMIGTFLLFEFWFERKLEHMKNMNASTSVGVLRCFAAMLTGVHVDTKMHEVERIACLLSYWEVVHNLNAEFQAELLDLSKQLVDLHLHKIEIKFPINELVPEEKAGAKQLHNYDKLEGKTDKEEEHRPIKFHKALEERFLMQVLVKVIAFAEGLNELDLRENALAILHKLAGTTEHLNQLYESHIGDFIDLIEDLELQHSDRSDRILLLAGCLSLCGFRRNYFNEMKQAILKVLANSDPTAKIKILSTISMALMNWKTDMSTTPLEERTDLLKLFVKEAIEPCLIWKAGRSAESVRTMATQVLNAMAQGAPEECASILPAYAVIMHSLIEDNNAITRTYALRSIMNSGPFTAKEYSDLAMCVLGRLDDACSNCRLLATQCISTLQYRSDGDNTQPEAVIKHIISTLILHTDDPEIKAQPFLTDSIIKLSQRHPSVAKGIINQITTSHSKHSTLLDLKDKFGEISLDAE